MSKIVKQLSFIVFMISIIQNESMADTPIEPTSPANRSASTLTEEEAPTLSTDQGATKLTRHEQQEQPKEELSELEFRSIRELSLRISATKKAKQASGYLPPNRAQQHLLKSAAVEHPIGFSRAWSVTAVEWQPTALCHGPLYFEETNAERYGNTVLMQPLVSTMHFFGTIPVMSYKMALQPPWQCQYTLGYDRPGNDVPYYLHLPPRNRKGVGAAVVQGMVTTGLMFVLP